MALFKRRRGRKLTDGEGLRVTTYPSDWPRNHWDGLRGSYGYLWRTQPNVRKVVSFLGEQVASVSLKVYERVPASPSLPSGKIELRDHPMKQMLMFPNPNLTAYDLWTQTVQDLCIYDIAFWRKLRIGSRLVGVARAPVVSLNPFRDPLTNQIQYYTDPLGNRVSLDELVIFPGYDPELTFGNVSPLETLRGILAEEQAARLQRAGMWRNGARREGVIEFPVEAPKISPEAAEAFRADFEATMTGAANAGRVGIIRDGGKWNPDSFNPKEMEYLGGRQATSKESAALYGVDPRLVFALDDPATPELRTGFYKDRLVPLCGKLSQQVDRQLLPEFEPLDSTHRVYSRFNIEAKLEGSFEEQMKLLVMAAGRPIISPDEARDKLVMPPAPNGQGEGLTLPLNVAIGGQASPMSQVDTPGDLPAPGQTPNPSAIPRAASVAITFTDAEYKWLLEQAHKQAALTPPEDVLPSVPEVALQRRADVADRYAELISKTLARQGRLIIPIVTGMRNKGLKTGEIDMVWGDQARWDAELASDIQKLTESVVDENARRAIRQLKRKTDYDPQRTRKYIAKASANAAVEINAKTRQAVTAALADASGDELDGVFSDTGRAALLGTSFGTQMINFARNEGATQGGGKEKTWIVTSRNSRHPEMNGETVGIRDTFSNGLPWPGAIGDPAESASCQCLLDLG